MKENYYDKMPFVRDEKYANMSEAESKKAYEQDYEEWSKYNRDWDAWSEPREVDACGICDGWSPFADGEVDKEEDNKMSNIMPCGHDISEVIHAGEGANYCGVCEREAREQPVNSMGRCTRCGYTSPGSEHDCKPLKKKG